MNFSSSLFRRYPEVQIFMKQQLKASYRERQRRETAWDIAFLAPQFIIYFALTILPFIIAIPILMTDQIGFIDTDIDFIGLQNFANIFKSPMVDMFLPAVKKTAIFMLINYSTVFIFGMTLALLMYEIMTMLGINYIIIPILGWMGLKLTPLVIPDQLWVLLTIGVNGYIVSRGVEKVITKIKK